MSRDDERDAAVPPADDEQFSDAVTGDAVTGDAAGAAVTADAAGDAPLDLDAIARDEAVLAAFAADADSWELPHDDEALRALAAVLLEVQHDLATAVERMESVAARDGDDVGALTPAAASPDAEQAVGRLRPGSAWGRSARRGTVVALAAVVSMGGVAAASVVATPDSPLYGVKKLILGHDRADEQAWRVAKVTEALDAAEAALATSDAGRARGRLNAAAAQLGKIDEGEQRAALVERHALLTAALEALEDGRPAPRPTGESPTVDPTQGVTESPTTGPSDEPPGNGRPTDNPGNRPTDNPGNRPTDNPGNRPTDNPGNRPTDHPGKGPGNGSGKPTDTPGNGPDKAPGRPTDTPGNGPDKDPGKPTSVPGRGGDKPGRPVATVSATGAPDAAGDDDGEGRQGGQGRGRGGS